MFQHVLYEVAEAEVPSEDVEVMNEPRSLARVTEDCRRVEAVNESDGVAEAG
jgi:hypothetical protein